MISKDKNKWGSENSLLPRKSEIKTKSKILVLGLVVIIILVEFFGSAKKAQAASQ